MPELNNTEIMEVVGIIFTIFAIGLGLAILGVILRAVFWILRIFIALALKGLVYVAITGVIVIIIYSLCN